MEQFTKIKSLVECGLSIVYKNLSIGPIVIDDKKHIQVHCDRFDLSYSKFYLAENTNLAVSKFIRLLTKYMASEIENGS